MSHRPLLHDLVVALAAPTQAWAGPDGQLHGDGAQGVFHSDVRVLRRAVVSVSRGPAPGRGAGAETERFAPESIAAAVESDSSVVLVTALLRDVEDPGHDAGLVLRRVRAVRPGGLAETWTLSNGRLDDAAVRLHLDLASDLATMDAVREGRTVADLAARLLRPGVVGWSDGEVSVQVDLADAELDLSDPVAPQAYWDVVVPGRGDAVVLWGLEASDERAVVGAAPAPSAWDEYRPPTDHPLALAWTKRAIADLRSLLMARVDAPDDVFAAAGAPWFLTLFGRDSLLTARMLLPLGPDLAGGTLRTLAALQGTRVDPVSAEQPGRIPHEVRRGGVELAAEGIVLPPVYYGTVDATPLWVCLLHDAWRAGLPDAEVAGLLPALRAALDWMADFGDADGDGFLEYVDESGHGLANQGWKDSSDAVRFRDGRVATGPVALVEVQGYAYEAAVHGAALLDAFGEPGGSGEPGETGETEGDRWRAWAADLAGRFRRRFWTEDQRGRYPGLALDGDKMLVDAVSSNIGHLLGTGLLSAQEAALVASRVLDPDLSSGYGLRTMAASSGGYWPLSYHCGSVWAHDTAIVIGGLLREGRAAEARDLASGLLRAATDFGFGIPELHAGYAATQTPRAVPYPTACRPQAWSAAAAIVVAETLGETEQRL